MYDRNILLGYVLTKKYC